MVDILSEVALDMGKILADKFPPRDDENMMLSRDRALAALYAMPQTELAWRLVGAFAIAVNAGVINPEGLEAALVLAEGPRFSPTPAFAGG